MPTRESMLHHTIAGDFVRHPQQLNRIMEADAELIRLPGNENEWLVLKTDGIHEEIQTKLYDEPWLIGWMTVTAPVSDIAAVGAQPTGVLLSLVLNRQHNTEWLQQFKLGVQAACSQYHMYVLGGDTNYDTICTVSATVMAHISGKQPLLRSGIQPGDWLYASGPLGLGNAYAYHRFFDASVKVDYRPMARLDIAGYLSPYATACTDTSDGLFPSLAVLAEINHTGFQLTTPLGSLLHQGALDVCAQAHIPEWMLLAGPHGEYELLFTVAADRRQKFEANCDSAGWQPLLLGIATGESDLNFVSGSSIINCQPDVIPDLFHEAGGNITAYYTLLQKQHARWH